MTDGTCWASPATERVDMARTLLLRGMLAGVLAGIIAVGFAALFGEPPLDSRSASNPRWTMRPAMRRRLDLVSRAVQSSAGLLVAGVACGAALGGVVALVFAFAYQRVGRAGPKALAVLLAGAGFVTVVLVPQLKYPANPPSIGDAETIGLRTALYFEMILIALAALTLADPAWTPLAGAARGLERLARGRAGIHLPSSPRSSSCCPMSTRCRRTSRAIVLWRFRIASFRHAAHAMGVAWCDLRRAGRAGIVRPPRSDSELATTGPGVCQMQASPAAYDGVAAGVSDPQYCQRNDIVREAHHLWANRR